MENATKALLIAGGVLLAMMILATGIILYNTFSNTASSYTTRMDLNEKTKFNSNFEVFRGRDDITAQDIVTLYNLAEEYKNKTYIDVTVTVNSITISNTIDFLKDHSYDDSSNEIIKYTCESIGYDDDEGYVTSITFSKTT